MNRPVADSTPIRRRSRLDTLSLRWQERIVDRVRGRRPCALLENLLQDPLLAGRPVRDEVAALVHKVIGRQFTATVVGDHPHRQSLTDLFERGGRQAALIAPFVKPHETVLEYGAGIGRIARHLSAHVSRLVAVDVDPLADVYGSRLSPTVQFMRLDALPPAPQFDGAYSVAVFFHLPLEQQRAALQYVYDRLKPGGWFLVDLKLGPHTEQPDGETSDTTYGPVRATALDDFRALFEPLFTARRVPLFNSGFLLQKRAPNQQETAPVEGRLAVNDASVVFDVLEGQVVVVNLDTGAYYILEGTAGHIWQMLAAGMTRNEVSGTLAHHYGADATEVATAVEEFVGQLLAESMLVPATGREPAGPPFDPAGLGERERPFMPPLMFRYTDMQALIQMDPIREFDETGWPKRHTPPPAPPRPE